MGPWISGAMVVIDAVKWIYNKIVAVGTELYNLVVVTADLIHFDTLMQLNQVAAIVSRDYREMRNKVYGEISAFSESVGFGAMGIATVLEATRQVTLDISAMSGHRYDIGQVGWIGDLNKTLTAVQARSKEFETNPGVLFDIIDSAVRKRHVNRKAWIMGDISSKVSDLMTKMVLRSANITRLFDDLETLQRALPNQIAGILNPLLENVGKPFEDFRNDRFIPFTKQTDRLLLLLALTAHEEKAKLQAAAERIANPGKLLQAVDELPDRERIDQEAQIAEVASRDFFRDAAGPGFGYRSFSAGLLSVRNAIAGEYERPGWMFEEVTGGKVHTGEVSSGVTSAFPGDF